MTICSLTVVGLQYICIHCLELIGEAATLADNYIVIIEEADLPTECFHIIRQQLCGDLTVCVGYNV